LAGRLGVAKGKIALREAGSLKASLGLSISPMRSFIPAGLMLVLACLTTSRGQEESGGVLIYHDPLVSYTEALEYRAFRQDNPLYCTVFASNGRKQMKSGSVLAVVPYPPSTFEPVFEETAGTALQKIDSLIAAHPQVKPQLEVAKQKWSRALAVFRETTKPAPTTSRASTQKATVTLPAGARLTNVTRDSVTITHSSGVSRVPLRGLTPAQILALNATSQTIQLPLGIDLSNATSSSPASSQSSVATDTTGLTHRLELAGRTVIAFAAKTLGIDDLTFSVWTFFAVLPGLALLLLIAFCLKSRRPKPTVLPARRPIS